MCSLSSASARELLESPVRPSGAVGCGRGHLVGHGLQLLLPLPELLLQQLILRDGLLQLGLEVVHLPL